MNSQAFDLTLLRDESKKSLYFFAKGVLRYDWLVPHVHGDVCRELENLDHTDLMFVLPRGWLKSTICSIAYPIWRACFNPNVRILLAQNSQSNARKKLKVIREQFESNPLLRAMFPEVLPGAKSIWSADSLCLSRTGSFPESTFECCGVRSQVVSRHYDDIIEDDTVAPDLDELGQESLAPTSEDIENAIGWHKLAIHLLNNPPAPARQGRRLVVGTRWYEKDLIDWVQTNETQYRITTRACRETNGLPDPHGEITYPERFDADRLRVLEVASGPYFFDCLYMNHPVRTGDMVFSQDWIKYYTEIPPRQSLMVFTTVDPATDPELSRSKKGLTDFSTVVTCGKDLVTGNIFVLDYFRERCNPGHHMAAVFDHVIKWKPIEVGYENVAYQKSIDYYLKEMMRQRQQYFILRPIVRGGRASKETHIMGLQPIFAAGVVYLRGWMREMVTELLSFPRGTNDDLIDALAMQSQMWRRTRSKNESRQLLDDNNPLSFNAACEELRGRKTKHDSICFDAFRTASPINPPLRFVG